MQRTTHLPQVRGEQRDIAGQWPAGRFDLIVFSEILYYLGDHDLEQLLDRAAAALQPARLVRHAEPDFLAEVYLRTDGALVSVAQATGLV